MGNTVRWYRIGLLAALSILLSYLETFVPIPIPGVKLGLANIPVLVALSQDDAHAATSIAAIKVLATGLLFGSPVTLAYSLTGTAVSLLVMIPLTRLNTMRLWMASIAGAVAHEVAQLGVATLIMGNPGLWYLTPLLMVAGIASGALSGVIATRLKDVWPNDRLLLSAVDACERPQMRRPRTTTLLAGLLFVVFCLVLFHLEDSVHLAIALTLSASCCLALRTPVSSWLRTIRLTLALTLATLVLGLISSPQTAIPDTLHSSLRLWALLLAGTATAGKLAEQELLANLIWLLQPLRHLGADVDGFALALNVAINTMPATARLVRGHIGQSKHISLRDLNDLLPQILRELFEMLAKQNQASADAKGSADA